MPGVNTNVGEISSFNVAIQGNNPNMQTTSDKGSILAVKYIKDDGTDVANPSNITTIELKNWFVDYVGTIGKFNKQRTDDVNIKWSDYKGATILGFKVEAKNESYDKYQGSNNAKLRITPINGSTNNFKVFVGGWSSASNGNAVVSSGSNAQGNNQSVTIKDLTTGVNISMSWNPGYNSDGGSSITSSNTTGAAGLVFNFTWAGGDRAASWSNPMYFFMGPQATRPYGAGYPN
jgi:hypothetical protein